MLNDPGPFLRNTHQHACTPNCGRPLHVQKTVTRTVVDADRPLPITEVYLHCPRHERRIFEPGPITPPKSIYAFDLIALVGQRRFLAHKHFSEIQEELAERTVQVPSRTLQWLADRFPLYTVAVHLESLALLARKLHEQGGYVLLIDGTGKAGRMVLQLTDGWSPGVLLSATVPNESQEALVPALRQLDALLGRSVAAVRDMSKGIDKALRAAWPGLLILTCHMHFLRAEGITFFDRLYPRFRLTLNRRGVKTRLFALRKNLRKANGKSREARQSLVWAEKILASRRSGEGLAYPFFLAEVGFYRRARGSGGR